jgi:4-hydroxy-2-oxoheptanedioate aldolase
VSGHEWLFQPAARLWADGRSAANGWITCPPILSAEALATAKWDSITVDMQHGTADYAALITLLPVIECSRAAGLVRVPWLDEASIMRALDAGALGIIAPMVDRAADARRLVKACLYAPEHALHKAPR